VAQHVADTNPGAIVEHDQHLPGRHSGVPRQVDVLARSEYEGQTVTAVYECKHYGRSVSLGTVEEFIGKLGDLAVDRGGLVRLRRNHGRGSASTLWCDAPQS
jgi:transposase InsO family protein